MHESIAGLMCDLKKGLILIHLIASAKLPNCYLIAHVMPARLCEGKNAIFKNVLFLVNDFKHRSDSWYLKSVYQSLMAF